MRQREDEGEREGATAAPVASAAAPDYLEGWLEKKAEWRPMWDKRYARLRGTRLAYQFLAGGPERKAGTIATLSQDPAALTFTVWLVEGEQWTLRAPTEAVYREWVTRIAETLRQEANNPELYVSASAVELTAVVEKLSAWKAVWKRRLLELRKGFCLSYRSVTVNSADRNQYVVASVDRYQHNGGGGGGSSAADEVQDRLMLFMASNKSYFWVKFATAAECALWYAHIHAALRGGQAWVWQPVPHVPQSPLLTDSAAELRTTRLSTLWGRAMEPFNTVAEASALGVEPTHFHAAALWTDSHGDSIVSSYGGSAAWCRAVYCGTATRLFVPQAPRESVSAGLQCYSLQGQHLASAMTLEPYQERAHVRVRPPPSYGGSLTALPMPGGTVDSNSSGNSSGGGAQLLLVGGTSPGGGGCSGTELWSAVFPARASDFAPYWSRFVVDESVFPALAFHAAALSPGGAGHGESQSEGYATVVVTGGVLAHLQEWQGRCYAVQLPRGESPPREGGYGGPAAPRVVPLGALPEPRAFHGMVALRDGTLLLVGGRTARNGAPSETLLALPPADLQAMLQEPPGGTGTAARGRSRWVAPSYACAPLPPLLDVAVSNTFDCDGVESVAVIAQQTDPTFQVRLFILSFPDAGANSSHHNHSHSEDEVSGSGGARLRCVWREITRWVGCAPLRAVGVSLHAVRDYLYVFGSVENDPDSNFLYPINDPIRILMDERSPMNAEEGEEVEAEGGDDAAPAAAAPTSG